MSRPTDGFSAMIRVFTRLEVAPWATLPSRPCALPFYYFVGSSLADAAAVSAARHRGGAASPEGGFVLSANHLSNLDPWPLGLRSCPKRQLRFMAKVELFAPLWPILDAGGAFPVRRGESDQRRRSTPRSRAARRRRRS